MSDLTNIQPRPPISNYSPLLHQFPSDSCSPPEKQNSSPLLAENLEEPEAPKSSSKKSKNSETPNSNSKKPAGSREKQNFSSESKNNKTPKGDETRQDRTIDHSPGQNTKSNTCDSQSKSSYGTGSAFQGLFYAALGVAVASGIGYALLKDRSFTDDRSNENWVSLKKDFKALLGQELRSLFPSQPPDALRDIYLALSKGMQEQPGHPGLLLLLSGPGGRSTTRCLTRKLLEYSFPLFNQEEKANKVDKFIIQADQIQALSNGQAKFYDRLNYQLASTRVAAVDGLGQLSGDIALVLHGFADDSVAPYKRSVLIMTLEDDGEEEMDKVANPAWRAEELLSRQWKQISSDKASALITRVTTSVVKVLPESSESLLQSCP